MNTFFLAEDGMKEIDDQGEVKKLSQPVGLAMALGAAVGILARYSIAKGTAEPDAVVQATTNQLSPAQLEEMERAPRAFRRRTMRELKKALKS